MSDSKPLPTLGVVVPAKDETAVIDRCLAALARERTDGSLDKIIVADNMSADGTADLAARYADEVIRVAGPVSRVRNVGADHAACDYLAFVDADVVVEPGWARAVHEHIEGTPVGDRERLVFGATCGVPRDAGWIARSWFRSLAARSRQDYVNSGNMVVSRPLFRRLDGFDAALSSGEDVDLCRRAKQAGGHVALVDAMAAVHLQYPSTIGEFFARERWHGRNMLRYYTSLFRDKALSFALLHIVVSLLAAALALTGDAQGLLVTIGVYVASLATLVRLRVGACSALELLRLTLLYSVYGFARAFALAESLVRR